MVGISILGFIVGSLGKTTLPPPLPLLGLLPLEFIQAPYPSASLSQILAPSATSGLEVALKTSDG